MRQAADEACCVWASPPSFCATCLRARPNDRLSVALRVVWFPRAPPRRSRGGSKGEEHPVWLVAGDEEDEDDSSDGDREKTKWRLKVSLLSLLLLAARRRPRGYFGEGVRRRPERLQRETEREEDEEMALQTVSWSLQSLRKWVELVSSFRESLCDQIKVSALLDVRPRSVFEEGHVRWSTNIPFDDLPERGLSLLNSLS